MDATSGSPDMGSPFITLERARVRLARIWFIGAGLLFAVLTFQSILGKYKDDVADVWSWFVPTTVPTLMLMVGVIGGSATYAGEESKVKRSFYDISQWLSWAYLIILASTIFSEPFAQVDAVKLFKLSNYWLTPMQGLTAAAIGFLFTSKREDAAAKTISPKPANVKGQ